jgi:hypothetical protein
MIRLRPLIGAAAIVAGIPPVLAEISVSASVRPEP